jgi:hypothetical protein
MAEDETVVTPQAKLADPELLGTTERAGRAGAVLMALTLGVGVFGFAGSQPITAGDRVSSADSVRLAEAFRHAKGALLPVDVSTQPRKDHLVQSLRMPKMQAEQLIALIERGERMLGWLTLWDNYDEDGDVVSVTAAGFTQSVALTHAQQRILVPYVPGQPVFITGERDGLGGGVTVAVELSTGPLPLPPLAVGQTIALPIQ